VLAAADVACLPSRQEAFGNVVLEACAAGVPVVTTRRAGAAELLQGPLAALVVDDPEDLVALARALAHALGPEHDALARAARARALGEALRRVRLAGRAREPVADLTRLRGVGGCARARRARLRHPRADRRDRVPARRPAEKELLRHARGGGRGHGRRALAEHPGGSGCAAPPRGPPCPRVRARRPLSPP